MRGAHDHPQAVRTSSIPGASRFRPRLRSERPASATHASFRLTDCGVDGQLPARTDVRLGSMMLDDHVHRLASWPAVLKLDGAAASRPSNLCGGVSEFAPAEEEERQRGAVERLALFTDAVVAIVITLMVLEVKPPHIRAEGELLPALRGLWHEYLAVAISFLVIGLFWTRHHALFQWVKRHDARL